MLKTWSQSDVCAYLDEIGLSGYVDKFTVSHEAWRKHVFRKHGPEQPNKHSPKLTNLFRVDNTLPDECLHETAAQSFLGEIQIQNETCGKEEVSSFENLQKLYLHFLLKLRGEGMLSARITQLVNTSLENIIEGVVESVLYASGVSRSNYDVQQLLAFIKNLFQDSSPNEYTFMKKCEKEFDLIRPVEMSLPDGGFFYYIPIKEVLCRMLKKTEFVEILKRGLRENKLYAGSGLMFSYRDGSIAQKRHIDDKILVQLYTDEITCVSPLRGRQTEYKTNMIYFRLDDLPQEMQGLLCNIHLVAVGYSHDMQTDEGLSAFWAPVKSDLMSLNDDGLLVKDEVYKFTSSTVCSDNLAAHRVGGFQCSFSSGRVCRYCLIPYKELANISDERSSVCIRTVDTHNEHVRHVTRFPNDASIYGVKGPSCLLGLPGFHPISSLPPDVMHDLMEGVMPLITSAIFSTIVHDRLMTVKQLLDLVNNFSYGRHDRDSTPPLLKDNHIRDQKIPGKAIEKY
ncbi:unnamed protein product, partial [Didymodactylos carnosus]